MGELMRILRDEKGKLYSQSQVESNPALGSIAKETNLVYDCKTKVVYYNFEANRATLARVGFMSPYISENGNYCRFIYGEITEIY